jgi:hypothetical protein
MKATITLPPSVVIARKLTLQHQIPKEIYLYSFELTTPSLPASGFRLQNMAT